MTAVADPRSTPFNYKSLSKPTRLLVRHRTSEIKALNRRVAGDIYKMGLKFDEVREALRHNKAGGFERWWASEGFKKQFVYNCIGVYETFLNCPNFGQLDIAISALYLLILPSAKPEIRQEIVIKAQSGEKVTYTDVLNAVSDSAPALPAPAKPLRFQPGMVAHCSHCKMQFGDPNPFGPVYDFEQWKLESPNLWRCPNGSGHRTADPILNIIAKESPASVFALAPGMKLLYASQRGVTCHLAQPGASHTFCDELVNYLTDRPRVNVAYRPCENCAKAAWKLIGPTEVVSTPATEDGKRLNYNEAERAWCPNCAAWQHFLIIGQDICQCKQCGRRVPDDAIEVWTEEGEAAHNPKPASWPKSPSAKSVATSSVSAFIPGSGALPAVASPNLSVKVSGELQLYKDGEEGRSDEWYTPKHILDRVIAVLGSIDLDPCSNKGTPNVPAAQHFTVDDDGLSKPWKGRVYINPPYGRVIQNWIDNLLALYADRQVTQAIALVPSRTDTEWFQDLAGRCPFCLIRGRLRFLDETGEERTGAPFPSAIFYLGASFNFTRFAKHFEDLGVICHPTRILL